MIHLLEDVALASTIIAVAMTIVVIVAVTFVVRWWRSSSLESYAIQNPPKDIVILHQFGKGLTAPSISPFVMKLETYLRIAKIPYINKFSRKPGPRQKLPWIQYNDNVVPDSQLCIQFLNLQRSIDLNNHLTPTQTAIGHLIRMTAEESLYWTLLMWRLVFETSGVLYKDLGLPSIIVWYLRRVAHPRLWSHGIGRYSKVELTQIMEDDLSAISQILGERKFLFGNSVDDVTEFDCALFGQLCELVWQVPGTPVGEMIGQKFPNLVQYCERMKNTYWPDWDQRLLNPPRKSADKQTPEAVDENIHPRTEQTLEKETSAL